jgi:Zn-dependent oligopeptidase
MHGIQCYAGYKLDDDYAPTHVVVIMINNLKDRAAVKAAAEEMLLSIFATS